MKTKVIILISLAAVLMGTGIYMLARQRKLVMGSDEANKALGEMKMY